MTRAVVTRRKHRPERHCQECGRPTFGSRCWTHHVVWESTQVQLNLARRFWSKVDMSGGLDACWPWQGELSKVGYGRFWVGKGNVLAHRAAKEITAGPIPAGLVVMHHCDNPVCCNPVHLSVGTARENVLDAVRKGRYLSGAAWYAAHPRQARRAA
jgi:hypothetical protein